MQQIQQHQVHRDHRIFAVYDDADATVFHLPPSATLADLCEQLEERGHGHAMPVHVEVNVGH